MDTATRTRPQLGQGMLQGMEIDLRPGNGVAGGEYPFWVVMTGDGTPANAVYGVRLQPARPRD